MSLEIRNLLILGSAITALHVGAFWGATYLLEAHGASMPVMITKMDQIEYLQLADTMLNSGRFALSADSAPEIFRTPGYPTFIALVNILTGDWYWGLFITHALLLGLIAVLVALMSNELGFSRKTSIVAGTMMGLSSGSLLLSSTATGSDILYTCLYTFAAYQAIRITGAKTLHRSIIIGGVLGIATLTRPIGILASLPLIFGFSLLQTFTWRSYIRNTLVALTAWAMVLAPWYVRNTVVAGTPILSTVSLFNMTYYNIPMNEYFWRHTDEKLARDAFLAQVGTSSVRALRSGEFIAAMHTNDKEYLSTHGFEYGLFHLYRTLPFFFMSGFNVINAVLSHEAPTLHMPLFPTESENLTQLVADHRWSAALSAVSKYWFTTLERVSWLIAIILGFLSPHMAKGHTRRVLMFFIAIILVNIVLISPVTQARLRFPAEPFIWSAAVAGYCLWRNRPSAGKVL